MKRKELEYAVNALANFLTQGLVFFFLCIFSNAMCFLLCEIIKATQCECEK